jgi:hypothetical protein
MKFLIISRKSGTIFLALFMLCCGCKSLAILNADEIDYAALRNEVDEGRFAHWYYIGSKDGYFFLFEQHLAVFPMLPDTKIWKIKKNQLNLPEEYSDYGIYEIREAIFRRYIVTDGKSVLKSRINFLPRKETLMNNGQMTIKEFYASGFIKSIRSYIKDSDDKWMLSGDFILYNDQVEWVYIQSKMKEKAFYKNGKLDGQRRIYKYEDKSFLFYEKQNWKNGELIGKPVKVEIYSE